MLFIPFNYFIVVHLDVLDGVSDIEFMKGKNTGRTFFERQRVSRATFLSGSLHTEVNCGY